MPYVKRRQFITLLGGIAAAWPLAARAQQERMRRLGVLTVLAESDPEARVRVGTIEKALQEHGWINGRCMMRRTLPRPGTCGPSRREDPPLGSPYPVLRCATSAILAALSMRSRAGPTAA
jgi:hypothetical protein